MKQALRCAAVLLVLCMLQVEARANEYLFTITASDLLLGNGNGTGLANAVTAEQFSESAYFAIFLQPEFLTNYTFVTFATTGSNPPPLVSGPPNAYGDNGNNDSWEATTIDDPSSPILGGPDGVPYQFETCTSDCTWAQFAKQQNQSQVMVFSDANGGPGGSNIFLGSSYTGDPGPYDYGDWGNTGTGTIDYVNSTNSSAVLQFVINTPQTLSGPVDLLGYADYLQAGSPNSEYDGSGKPTSVAFTLEETPQLVPEPASWGLVFAGSFALWAAYRRRKNRA